MNFATTYWIFFSFSAASERIVGQHVHDFVSSPLGGGGNFRGGGGHIRFWRWKFRLWFNGQVKINLEFDEIDLVIISGFENISSCLEPSLFYMLTHFMSAGPWG